MTCQPAWQLPIRHGWRRRAWGLTPTGQNDRTPEVWLTLAAVTDLD
jgi:hypothetical protein